MHQASKYFPNISCFFCSRMGWNIEAAFMFTNLFVEIIQSKSSLGHQYHLFDLSPHSPTTVPPCNGPRKPFTHYLSM